ncbi:MAG: class I SAM-dependent methyltransferase [Methylovulum sp.]|uniref:class I SAM-dependent methyltransferase n=1 Tax=Methylovulum sp. TaxID=1916980 RepID=UPI00262FCA15|nr:class I SAM-dependent methyltransferase [Methylovulum sp.]MDD2725359.1 class I SAM-dependent methyltransferase [Methylovulum sp.]MDD5124454.1 class I SAM-dependent methyltransferase [Methylovulum sp.]
MNTDDSNAQDTFDHGTHKEFVDYYAKESLSDASLKRMEGIFNCIKRNLASRKIKQKLVIADIGCGAGVMSTLWAQEGHDVHGLDVNEALLDLAKQRAHEAGLTIDYCLGSATHLPWENESMDVCIAPELLEHVVEWEACITEFTRILKPNGVLYISTANKLCPKQQEFNLPFYSWYPAKLKRHFENLARTTRPDIAGYATYPAVNWFSFYQLRDEFLKLGMDSYDRFDIMDIDTKPAYQKTIIKLIKHNAILRWLGHVATPGLPMLAIKKP